MNQTELYVKLSERTRVLVQEYFDLPKRLNFAFTHLVCRHALADGKFSVEFPIKGLLFFIIICICHEKLILTILIKIVKIKIILQLK